MNPLDTALEDLATSVENINDNNVSRVLSQQESAVANLAAAGKTMINVKVRPHPMKVREYLHR